MRSEIYKTNYKYICDTNNMLNQSETDRIKTSEMINTDS